MLRVFSSNELTYLVPFALPYRGLLGENRSVTALLTDRVRKLQCLLAEARRRRATAIMATRSGDDALREMALMAAAPRNHQDRALDSQS